MRLAWRCLVGLLAMASLVLVRQATAGEPGVSASEIKIGQTMPYSGPLSAYGTLGKAMAAYFAKVNAEGGVNGRRIELISLDDGYSPPRTVEQTRRLVENDGVFLMFASLGTPTNAAVQKYLNARQVPQLFLQSGAARWNDPRNYPWSLSGLPSSTAEARVYARYILANRPDARIAVLYQNDDFGKDYLNALRAGLGDRADRMIVAAQSYEVTDPTVESQIISLADSGADTFLSFSLQKPTSQAIRKAHELGWHPLHILPLVANSIRAVLTPAGLENAAGLVSTAIFKDPTDPRWQDDPDRKEWLAWMKQYYPEGSTAEALNVSGYVEAKLFVEVLRRCGPEVTRANALKQATGLRDMALPMMLPGITMTISAEDYTLFHKFQLIRFDGTQWIPIGEPIGG